MEVLVHMSDQLYEAGVTVISAMQTKFPDSGDFFMTVSKIADPKYTFTITFPLVYALSWSVGARLLGTVVVIEWVNMILKWLMHGHRPYWWVHETSVYNTSLPPQLSQFPLTCETGPGMPSGHLMITASTCYIIIHSFLERAVQPSRALSDAKKDLLAKALWILYVGWLGLVTCSRMYIATHFPHQCILGTIIGLSIARLMYDNTKWLHRQRHYFVCATAAIYLSAMGTYSLLLIHGGDPLWSVTSAVKWCVKRDYIHIDTLPFYSMMRYCGASLGLGVGLTSTYFKHTDRMRFTFAMNLVTILSCLFTAKMAEYIHVAMPKHNQMLFYTSEFVLNTIYPYLIIAVVPYFVFALSGTSTKRKFKKC